MTTETAFTIFSEFSEFCLVEEADGYKWEKTPVGADAIKSCPNGTTGSLYYFLPICLIDLGADLEFSPPPQTQWLDAAIRQRDAIHAL